MTGMVLTLLPVTAAAAGESATAQGGTATCTAKAVCEVCKAEYGEKNPDNEGHTIEVTFVGDTGTPETGDSSQRLLWITLLLASGFGVTGIVLHGRRQKEKNKENIR